MAQQYAMPFHTFCHRQSLQVGWLAHSHVFCCVEMSPVIAACDQVHHDVSSDSFIFTCMYF